VESLATAIFSCAAAGFLMPLICGASAPHALSGVMATVSEQVYKGVAPKTEDATPMRTLVYFLLYITAFDGTTFGAHCSFCCWH